MRVFTASFLALRIVLEKAAFPPKRQWQNAFFRPRLQLRKQPRILTAFLNQQSILFLIYYSAYCIDCQPNMCFLIMPCVRALSAQEKQKQKGCAERRNKLRRRKAPKPAIKGLFFLPAHCRIRYSAKRKQRYIFPRKARKL